MDPLTHVFLPLTVAYALFRDTFSAPRYLLLGGFGLVPDLDKLLGAPGLFHSLLTLLPLCAGLLLVDRWWNGDVTYGALAASFVLLHVFLDFLDGSGAYLLYPVVETGIGLTYPMSVTFGEGLLGFRFEGLPVELVSQSAATGFSESTTVESNSFGFLEPYGFASVLAFLAVYGGEALRDRRHGARTEP